MNGYGYLPTPTFFVQDPLSEYAEQLLTEWGVTNGHIIHEGKCKCGAVVPTDKAIRAHWSEMRLEKLKGVS